MHTVGSGGENGRKSRILNRSCDRFRVGQPLWGAGVKAVPRARDRPVRAAGGGGGCDYLCCGRRCHHRRGGRAQGRLTRISIGCRDDTKALFSCLPLLLRPKLVIIGPSCGCLCFGKMQERSISGGGVSNPVLQLSEMDEGFCRYLRIKYESFVGNLKVRQNKGSRAANPAPLSLLVRQPTRRRCRLSGPPGFVSLRVEVVYISVSFPARRAWLRGWLTRRPLRRQRERCSTGSKHDRSRGCPHPTPCHLSSLPFLVDARSSSVLRRPFQVGTLGPPKPQAPSVLRLGGSAGCGALPPPLGVSRSML